MLVKKILLFSLLILGIQLSAQDGVQFTASTKPVVQEGERFRVVYEINAEGSSFKAPDFGSLQVLSGPSTSTSSNIQYVNGKMSKSYTVSYTYVVQAGNKGNVNIGPAEINVDGKAYHSNALDVTIVEGSSSNGNATTSTQGNQNKRDPGVLQSDDVYITATVDNTNPFIGEEIIVTYRIYTKIPVSNLTLDKISSFNGFWSKSLMDNNSQYKQSTEVINGQEYVTAEIHKVALFPQKSGKLTIEPAEISCTAQIRVQNNNRRSNDPFENFFNDPFFNRNVKNVNAKLRSKALTIDVKPLPQANKPERFNGVVGTYRIKSSIDRNHLTANDALTLTIDVSGSGNIDLITLPEINFPSDFEAFEPKVTTNAKTSPYGISGTKKFEYLLIPRNPGDFDINPVDFSYFNPKTRKYVTESTDAYHITVEKGDGNSAGITYSASAQEDIRFIGKDIRHIKVTREPLKEENNFLFASSLFYIIVALILFLPLILSLVIRNNQKKQANLSLIKNKKANKIARNRLAKALKLKDTGDDKGFYDEIAQAIWGYIGDKFNMPTSDLSMESVREALQNKKISDEIINAFTQNLNNIEFARFAPGDAKDKMESIYNEAISSITQAENALKQ